LTNRQIAERLAVGERTVDSHVEHVRNKLGVRTRAQIARWLATREDGGVPASFIKTEPAATGIGRRP
jgi:DNA-binding response OmpR family regulator